MTSYLKRLIKTSVRGALDSCKHLAMYLDSNDQLIADVLAVTLHLVCLYKSYSQLAM